jgi:membrane dipeptidase
MTFLLDAHLDIAYGALAHGRDFQQPAWITRHREWAHYQGQYNRDAGIATVGLPDLLLARVGVVFGTIYVSPAESPFATPSIAYETPEQAYRQAMHQMDYYHRLADENPRIRLIRTHKDLDEVLASWEPDREIDEHLLGIVILMEGADPILEPKQLEEWYERGLRIVGPAWRATRYSAGTGAPGKLTPLGHELLDVMGDLNMLLDTSHLAEGAFFEAIDRYPGPIIASHSNPTRFCEGDRQLTDAMLRSLFERGGVVGVVLFNRFLLKGWTQWRDHRQEVTVERVVDVIDHLCQLAGDATTLASVQIGMAASV